MESLLLKKTNNPKRLAQNGFIYLSGIHHYVHILDHSNWESLQNTWNHLEKDPYMPKGNKCRYRRFGKFKCTYRNNEIEIESLQASTFFQNESINKLNGGINRKFAELSADFINNPLIKTIIQSDLKSIGIEGKFLINIHQIRTITNANMFGSPTPEGVHQDGHAYVAQHFIGSQNIKGGKSSIYDLDKNKIFSTNLTSPMDTIIVRDPEVFHEVDSIRPTDEKTHGYRDMMLIDYNFNSEEK